MLAVVRIELSELSAEQRGRIEAFLSLHDHGAAAGRSDRALLVDCVELDDDAIRTAARQELGVGDAVTARDLRVKEETRVAKPE